MADLEELQIRRATLQDMEEIEVLLQELIGNALVDRRKFFIKAFSSENYAGLLAECGKEAVGYVDLWGFPDPGHGAVLGVILNFIVLKDHRKKGIGDRLLEEAVKEAKRRDFKEFHVWTEFENEPAKAIYRKHGFTNESLVLEREFD
ncbi:MAG: GNAT family N-acetyltransferase [Thermoplasmata archaeon]|nr:MAG: GNAT family N-acetyltransferase [Thermoplasmata archaeon]